MGADIEVDYALAFALAPVGLVVSRHRAIVDCNQHLCEMFGASREQLVGQSFQVLYPTVAEFERTGERIALSMDAKGHYADDRIMQRVGGRLAGEVFWCHVVGRAFERSAPHAAGIWSFEDLSPRRPVQAALTPREREVAAHVLTGLTSKEIARRLGISHRTVEIYRAALMRKLQAATTADLAQRLLGG